MAASTRELYLLLRARDEASRVVRGFSSTLMQTAAAAQAAALRSEAMTKRQQAAQMRATGATRAQTAAVLAQARALDAQATKIETAERGQRRFAQSLTAVSGSLQTMGIAFALAGGLATKFLFDTTQLWQEYQRQVALTHTQIDGFEVSLRHLGDVGVDVARRIPVAFEDIQPTLFHIFSSTDANMRQATIALNDFSKAAVAGQTDVQTAAKGTVAIMNAYNIPLDRVNKVLDVQFELVRKGVGTYEQFANVFGRVIPAATRSGQSFETVAAMLAFMTRNGQSAAMASTSAARALEALTHPTTVGRLTDMGIRATDASGKFVPLVEILKELRERMLEVPEAERVGALFELLRGAGGTIQARRFLEQVLLREGDLEDFTSLLTSMGNASGVMEQKFAEMSNTAAAKMQLLSNRWMAFKLAVGEAATPVLLVIVEALSNLVEWFNNLDPSTKGIITQFLAWGAVLSLVIGALLILIGMLAGFVAAFTLAGSAILTVLGVIAAVVGAVVGLGTALILAWKNSEGFRVAVGKMASGLKAFWDIGVETATGLRRAFDEHLLPPLQRLWQLIEANVLPRLHDLQDMVAAEVIPKVREAGRIIKSVFANAFEILGNIIDSVVIPAFEKATEWWNRNQESIRPLIKILGQTVKWLLVVAAILVGVFVAALMAPIAAIGLIIGVITLFIFTLNKVIQFVKFVVGKVREFFAFLGGEVTKIWNNIADFFVDVWARIVSMFQAAMDVVSSVLTSALGFLMGVWQSFWNTFGGIAMGLWEVFMAAWTLFVTLFTEIWNDWLVPLGKFFGDVWKAIVILAQGAWNRLVTLFQTALAVIIGAWRLVWGTVSAFAQMIWNQILERIRGPLNTAKNNISSVLNTIKGIWNVAWTAVSSVVRERLNTAKTIVSGAITAIKNFFAGAGRWLYDAGRNIIRGLIDGIEDMLGGLADTLSGVTEWIKEHKGPKERDLRLLRPAGHFLMQGLMRGIADMVPDLSRQLGDISMMMAIQGPTLPSQVNQAPVGVVPQGEQPASTIINQDITVNTQEIDPVRHSTEIGWLLAMRR